MSSTNFFIAKLYNLSIAYILRLLYCKSKHAGEYIPLFIIYYWYVCILEIRLYALLLGNTSLDLPNKILSKLANAYQSFLPFVGNVAYLS